MQEKIEKVIQKIDWILLFDSLTSQEKDEFMVLKSGLLDAGDNLEFANGQTHIDLTFPKTYVSKKVLDFLHEYSLNIDGFGFDGDAWIWFEEDDDNSSDYAYDEDDWSYDYWDYCHRDDDCYDSDDYYDNTCDHDPFDDDRYDDDYDNEDDEDSEAEDLDD